MTWIELTTKLRELGLLFMAFSEEFFQIRTSGGNVPPKFRRGDFRIARLAGFEKNSMRFARLMKFASNDEVQARISITVCVQRFDERQHRRSIGWLVEYGMETPIPFAPMRHFRIEFQRGLILTKNFFGSCEIGVRKVWNREAEDMTFENGARFENLPNFFRGKRRDDSASIRDDGDEAFGGQVTERFANRNSARLKFLCDVILAELLAFL